MNGSAVFGGRCILGRALAGQLHGGGYLVIGPAESLKGIDHSLSYVEPTVYRKP